VWGGWEYNWGCELVQSKLCMNGVITVKPPHIINACNSKN
jgi:hypothetical protein